MPQRLAGQLLDGGDPVADEPVFVVDTAPADESNWSIVATDRSAADGSWSVTVPNADAERYHAVAQFEESGTLKNALSKPFLTSQPFAQAGAVSVGFDVVSPTVSVGSVIPDSGVFRYPFNNENSDTSVAQDVWNGYDGTVNGTTFDSDGGYDNSGAYSFDGNDYIRSASNAATTFSGTDPVSFAAWVYPDVLDGNWAWLGALDSEAPDSGRGEFGPQIKSDGEIRFVTSNGEFNSNGTIPSDSYSHLTMTMASDGTITGYIDGSPVGSESASIDEINVWDVGSIRFSGWVGRIDEPRLYNKTLTDSEVSNLYNTGSISG